MTDQRFNYFRYVAQNLWGQTTARWGMRWIAFLSLIAVFSPFLANSRPLLMHSDDGLSSPLIVSLSAADWSFVLLFIVLAILWQYWHRLSGKIKFTLIVIWALVSIALSVVISQSGVSVYDQYRVAEHQGEIHWSINPPVSFSPKDYLRDFGDTALNPPMWNDERLHIMGTDANGADVASRMIHASRVALGIGFVATGVAFIIGVIIGGLMGYFSGWVDMLGMRLVEVFEAIPTLFLLLTFVAFFGRSVYLMMLIIGLTSWPGFARYIRAEFLRLRQQDFVQAAIVGGLSLWSVLLRHLLPNAIAPVLVVTSFSVASAILAEATLSFLGLGVVDDPSWGELLDQAVRESSFNWWLALFPGGAIFLTVFAYNLIGEALRDAIDPQAEDDSP